MNFKTLTLYSILSRLPFLQKSYSLKILSVAGFGFLIPLLILSVYLFVNASLSLDEKLNVFIVFLIASGVGTIISLFFLYWLLYPISLMSISLHKYIRQNQPPQLPSDFSDSVGQLMREVQYMAKQLSSLNHSLKDSATIDHLTGLLNRRAGEERLRLDMARARRDENQILVVVLRVDKLNSINHKFGRHIGDQCLKKITNMLCKSVRESDWLARWDEGQFLMVLWNFNHANPTEVLERVQQLSIKIPKKGRLKLNLSIGACEYRGDTDLDTDTDLETLLIRLEDSLSQIQLGQGGGIVLIE